MSLRQAALPSFSFPLKKLSPSRQTVTRAVTVHLFFSPAADAPSALESPAVRDRLDSEAPPSDSSSS